MNTQNINNIIRSSVTDMLCETLEKVRTKKEIDFDVVKKGVELIHTVYEYKFAQNKKSDEDQYDSGFYLKYIPDSLDEGKIREEAQNLYEKYISNGYSIDPVEIMDFVLRNFELLKDNVYTYYLLINLVEFTTDWNLSDSLVYQFSILLKSES